MIQSADVNIVQWPGSDIVQTASSAASVENSKIIARLEGVLALVQAVEASEVLAAVPEDELGRMQYRSTISLLKLAERELIAICENLGC